MWRLAVRPEEIERYGTAIRFMIVANVEKWKRLRKIAKKHGLFLYDVFSAIGELLAEDEELVEEALRRARKKPRSLSGMGYRITTLRGGKTIMELKRTAILGGVSLSRLVDSLVDMFLEDEKFRERVINAANDVREARLLIIITYGGKKS